MKKATQKKIIGDIKKFTIRRSQWGRGNCDTAALLNSRNKKMCCLGFYALACGFEREDIKNLSAPTDLQNALDGGALTDYGKHVDLSKRNVRWKTRLLKKIYGCNEATNICSMLIQTNDDPTTDDTVKEKDITRFFKKIGVKVEFKD